MNIIWSRIAPVACNPAAEAENFFDYCQEQSKKIRDHLSAKDLSAATASAREIIRGLQALLLFLHNTRRAITPALTSYSDWLDVFVDDFGINQADLWPKGGSLTEIPDEDVSGVLALLRFIMGKEPVMYDLKPATARFGVSITEMPRTSAREWPESN